MTTYDMYDDAQNPCEHGEDAMGENVRVGNANTESNGRRFQETLLYIVGTMRRKKGGDAKLQGKQ